MASAFYWLDDDGTERQLTLSAGVTEVTLSPTRYGQTQATSMGGYRALWAGRQRDMLRVTLDRHDATVSAGQAFRRDLESMLTHLHLGGWVAFAGDTTKTGAAWLSGAPAPGAPSVIATAYSFALPSTPAVTLPIGTEVYLEGHNALLRKREMTTVGSTWTLASGGVIALQTAIRYGRSDDTPVLMRHRDYYPRLIMPAEGMGRSPMTSKLRLTYTYELELEVDIGGLVEVYEAGT